ncbi:hypothetical protein JCM11641_006511 [Rhodosporidiobolus odoratus]
MADRLPLELVQHIVQLSIPSPASPLSYILRTAGHPTRALQGESDTESAGSAVAGYNDTGASEGLGDWLSFNKVTLSSHPASLLPNLVELRIFEIELDPPNKRAFRVSDMRELVSPRAFAANPRTVIDIEAFADCFNMYGPDFLSTVRNLRLHPHASFGDARDTDWPAFVELEDVLFLESILTEDFAPELSLVILPTSVKPSSLCASEDTISADAISDLITARGRHRVEVIFEPTPHPFFDSQTSPEFWRRRSAVRQQEKAQSD